MTDYIKRADAIGIIEDYIGKDYMTPMSRLYSVRSELSALPSANAVPKWNCTANFVAEQLDRLRNMTDEERWDFFIKFFSPSAEPTEDYSDLPDIPRAYYEKIVGNMAHEINMLKEQLESADAEQGFRGGKIPPKEMLDGTVLIPKHQWLEMERELAELKDKFESADAVSREEYEEVKAYMDTLVDAFIEDGEELAESVKVVRCKDCQWFLKDHEDTWGNIDEYWCRNWGSPTDDCGYCHEAERRKS